MKKEILFIIIFLISISFANAQELITDYSKYSSVTMEFTIDGKILLVNENGASYTNEVITELAFYPQESTTQKILNLDLISNPKAQINTNKEAVEFVWNNPKSNELNYGLNSQIQVDNFNIGIYDKVDFPIAYTNSPYTKATENIDINENIKTAAEELVYGEDDLFFATFKVGSWVRENIKYNLTTLTADVVEKSSWVLDNKYGVCDEITNLFISMMRSVGVPAKFVSGVVYSNIGNTWQPHGWAEVYFPEVGWIPFDVTFGQYGWIDPTHIKLKESLDSGEPAVKYSWKANQVSLKDNKLELNTKLVSTGQELSIPLDLKIKTLVNNVGPGSYVPIEVELKNKADYYLPVTIAVTKADGLTEGHIKSLLLKPNEIKKVFWINKVPKNLDRGYGYISKIEVQDHFSRATSTELNYANGLKVYTLDDAVSLINKVQPPETKIISKKIYLDCSSSETAFIYENINVECLIKNKSLEPIENVNICMKTDCRKLYLDGNEIQKINFNLNLSTGLHNILIEANDNQVKTSDIVTINVLSNPGLEILNIEYPELVTYNEAFNISMTLATESIVKNTEIKINNKKVVEAPEINKLQRILISTKGKDVYGKENLTVDILYEDLNGIDYKVKYSYPINIARVPWYIRLLNSMGLI
jgi:hypothetical protein